MEAEPIADTPADVVPLSTAAKALGCSARTLSRLVALGRLKAYTAPNPGGPKAVPPTVVACSISEARDAWSPNSEWYRRGDADPRRGHADHYDDSAEATPTSYTVEDHSEPVKDGRKGVRLSSTDPLGVGRQGPAPSASLPVPLDAWLALTSELARLREDVAALRAETSKAPPPDPGKALADVLVTLEAQRAEREDAAERRRAGRVAVVVACAFGIMSAAIAAALAF
jgi:hypothetical protein